MASSASKKGIFLPTTQIWDIDQIKETDASDSLKELLIRMYQNLGNMATAINAKESAIYDTQEFVTGKVYFSNPNLSSETVQAPRQRQVIRKTLTWANVAAVLPDTPNMLPNASTGYMLHEIPFDANYILTDIYAAATDPTGLKYIELSYVSDDPAKDNIALWADGSKVYINTFGTDRRNFTICYIVIEYLKF